MNVRISSKYFTLKMCKYVFTNISFSVKNYGLYFIDQVKGSSILMMFISISGLNFFK